jgi:hypothetical protein
MKTVKSDGKFPVKVTEGGVSAKIRKTTQIKNGMDYVIYIVDYILHGKRKQVGRADFGRFADASLLHGLLRVRRKFYGVLIGWPHGLFCLW